MPTYNRYSTDLKIAAAAVTLFRSALRVKLLLITALSRRRSLVDALAGANDSVLRVFSQVSRSVGRKRALRLLGVTSNRMTRWMRRRRCPASLSPHSPGLRACRPNEIWHADVTVFRTLDNVKCFIYLVVDNFSRKILAWEVATHLSGALHLKTVREAVERFLPISESLSVDLTRLITDGGPENITDPSLPLVRQVALR